MPPTVQARLLRVLQERRVTPLGSTESYPVDIKLVSATNRNLKNEVREGRFRQDLYYRISGLNLELPAFRERADKTALVEYVHQRLSRQAGEDYLPLSSDLLAQFTNHPWPGNVRQLINVLSVALAMADGALIESWHLPDDFHDDLATADELPTSRQHKDCQATADNRAASANDASATELTGENLESRIIRLYDKMGGNISQTAKAAGVSRNTVYKYTRPE